MCVCLKQACILVKVSIVFASKAATVESVIAPFVRLPWSRAKLIVLLTQVNLETGILVGTINNTSKSEEYRCAESLSAAVKS